MITKLTELIVKENAYYQTFSVILVNLGKNNVIMKITVNNNIYNLYFIIILPAIVNKAQWRSIDSLSGWRSLMVPFLSYINVFNFFPKFFYWIMIEWLNCPFQKWNLCESHFLTSLHVCISRYHAEKINAKIYIYFTY